MFYVHGAFQAHKAYLCPVESSTDTYAVPQLFIIALLMKFMVPYSLRGKTIYISSEEDWLVSETGHQKCGQNKNCKMTTNEEMWTTDERYTDSRNSDSSISSDCNKQVRLMKTTYKILESVEICPYSVMLKGIINKVIIEMA